MNALVVETVIAAPPQAVFEAVRDIEAMERELPAFKRVEVSERTDDGFVATMYEEYGGREVVISSRFAWQEGEWVSYEHIDGPYGVNRGRFTVSPHDGGTLLVHSHETEQDISEGTKLRADWIELMAGQHAALERIAQAITSK
jgi:ribosome-associated toxin RatA of RatAB toxin-antitoxin module